MKLSSRRFWTARFYVVLAVGYVTMTSSELTSTRPVRSGSVASATLRKWLVELGGRAVGATVGSTPTCGLPMTLMLLVRVSGAAAGVAEVLALDCLRRCGGLETDVAGAAGTGGEEGLRS
jgi:hypothetical protein